LVLAGASPRVLRGVIGILRHFEGWINLASQQWPCLVGMENHHNGYRVSYSQNLPG
jgi:hypothetical protein